MSHGYSFKLSTSQICPQQHHEAYPDYVENNLLDYLCIRNNFPHTESLLIGKPSRISSQNPDRLHEVTFPSHEERENFSSECGTQGPLVYSQEE